jgi:hypothetical protein
MDRDGNIIIDVDDEKIGFRVSTWALKEVEKKAGLKGQLDLLDKIGLGHGNVNAEVVIILVMEIFNEYKFFKKEDMVINEREASVVVDRIGGPMEAIVKLAPGFKFFTPKNSQPPQKVGELISQ